MRIPTAYPAWLNIPGAMAPWACPLGEGGAFGTGRQPVV